MRQRDRALIKMGLAVVEVERENPQGGCAVSNYFSAFSGGKIP